MSLGFKCQRRLVAQARGDAMMVNELNLQPVYSGVVYSPGRTGWRFFPEEYLFVGLTGPDSYLTYVRSVLLFCLPELPKTAIVLDASISVRIDRNEPLDAPKHICLRAAPADPHSSWSEDEEMSMPNLAEHHLSTEIGLDLSFDMTGLMECWFAGVPNNGVVLGLGTLSPGLVAFPRTNATGAEPNLKLVYAVPTGIGEIERLPVAPDTRVVSRAMPYGEIAIRNLGPGLAWISPLYDLEDREGPVDPAGIPEGVLHSGGYIIITPRVPARRVFIRVETALSETAVLIIPLTPPI